MAETGTEEDKALDPPAEPTAEAAAGGSKKMLIIIVAAILVVVLLGGGAAAFFLLSGGEEGDAAVAEQAEPSEEAKVEKKTALYLPLKPPFVVKAKSSGRQRYLQMEVTLMTRDDKKLDQLKERMPQLRNQIVTAMSSQGLEELLQPEAREVLQQTLLADLQGMLEEETGDPMVEQVLFTTFIMQ